ncbi:MAG: carboxymuconolactone decarboxylase family protein [Candidatus Helarchaeota archaeon]
MSKTDFFKNLNTLLKKSPEYSTEILKFLKDFYGDVPAIYKIMENHNPEMVVTQFIKNQSITKETNSKLPLKTKELIALSAAVALGCKYCQRVHMKAAIELGATKEQIFETILISGMVAETSTLAVSLRELKELK